MSGETHRTSWHGGNLRSFYESLLVIAALLVCASGVASARGEPQAKSAPCTIHVLFLGNSYTYFNDMPGIFAQLAAAGGQCRVETRMVTPGGTTLKDHWDKPESLDALKSQHWDFVVLQDQSTLGMSYWLDGKPRVTSDELFRPYAEKWAAEITQRGARPVFFLTWARKTTPEDQAELNYAYIHAAKIMNSAVAPVGFAWQQVAKQDPAINLYYRDGSHPSPAGSYLAACVMYATVFQRNPAGLPAKISGVPVNLETEKLEPDKNAVLAELSDSEAKTLQNAAWQAWQSSRGNSFFEVHPARPPVPAFRAGDALTGQNLAGVWTGELDFYPGVGRTQITLRLERDGEGWKGHLDVNYPAKTFANESFDLADLRVQKHEFTFNDPKSAGVENAPIVFRGALFQDQLRGTAAARVEQKNGPPVPVLGEWTLHRSNH